MLPNMFHRFIFAIHFRGSPERASAENGYPQDIITLNINDVLNKNKEKAKWTHSNKKTNVIHSNKKFILLQMKVAPWLRLRRGWTTTVPLMHPINPHVKEQRKHKKTVPVTGSPVFSIRNGAVLIQTTRFNTAAALYLCSDLCWLSKKELKQTTTATATRTSPDKRLNEKNNSCARALYLCTFRCRSLPNDSVKWPSFSYFREPRPRRQIFWISSWNWSLALQV